MMCRKAAARYAVEMARDAADREDLLAEATALAERIELALHDSASSLVEGGEHVVIGFRANGAASFFFGADPVYQFNAARELRRVYRDGVLYKAARGRLVALTRVRSAKEVQLQRHELAEGEQLEFLDQVQLQLDSLAAALSQGRYEIVGQVPSDADVMPRVRHFLASQTLCRVAAKPNV